MEHPSKKFKHPSEALFVIVLRTLTKELSKLPSVRPFHRNAIFTIENHFSLVK